MHFHHEQRMYVYVHVCMRVDMRMYVCIKKDKNDEQILRIYIHAHMYVCVPAHIGCIQEGKRMNMHFDWCIDCAFSLWMSQK